MIRMFNEQGIRSPGIKGVRKTKGGVVGRMF